MADYWQSGRRGKHGVKDEATYKYEGSDGKITSKERKKTKKKFICASKTRHRKINKFVAHCLDAAAVNGGKKNTSSNPTKNHRCMTLRITNLWKNTVMEGWVPGWREGGSGYRERKNFRTNEFVKLLIRWCLFFIDC